MLLLDLKLEAFTAKHYEVNLMTKSKKHAAKQSEDERETIISQVPKDKMEDFIIMLTKRIAERNKSKPKE